MSFIPARPIFPPEVELSNAVPFSSPPMVRAPVMAVMMIESTVVVDVVVVVVVDELVVDTVVVIAPGKILTRCSLYFVRSPLVVSKVSLKTKTNINQCFSKTQF